MFLGQWERQKHMVEGGGWVDFLTARNLSCIILFNPDLPKRH